jgi:hypothetical protein
MTGRAPLAAAANVTAIPVSARICRVSAYA